MKMDILCLFINIHVCFFSFSHIDKQNSFFFMNYQIWGLSDGTLFFWLKTVVDAFALDFFTKCVIRSTNLIRRQPQAFLGWNRWGADWDTLTAIWDIKDPLCSDKGLTPETPASRLLPTTVSLPQTTSRWFHPLFSLSTEADQHESSPPRLPCFSAYKSMWNIIRIG